VDLVAIADPSEEMARVCADLQSRAVQRLSNMLDREAGIGDRCGATAQHAEVAYEAISRGIHVLVEKPIALTHAEGQIIDLAAKQRSSLR